MRGGFDPSEAVSEDDLRLFVQDCLRENGIVDADVKFTRDSFGETVSIVKSVGIDKYRFDISITTDEIESGQHSVKKKIATEIEQTAEEFIRAGVNVISWHGSTVKSCPKEGWIECPKCGTRINIKECNSAPGFVGDLGETPAPVRSYSDVVSAFADLDDGQKWVFNMYMIAQLKRSCDASCANVRIRNSFETTESFK